MSEIITPQPETTISAPVHFTPAAISEVKMLMYEKEIPESHYLRVGVKGGGCSGLSYVLGFDEKQADDEVFSFDGVRMIISKTHAMYILGMEIDYINGLNNRGFVFNNPNASSSCGCGTSFAV